VKVIILEGFCHQFFSKINNIFCVNLKIAYHGGSHTLFYGIFVDSNNGFGFEALKFSQAVFRKRFSLYRLC